MRLRQDPERDTLIVIRPDVGNLIPRPIDTRHFNEAAELQVDSAQLNAALLQLLVQLLEIPLQRFELTL